MIGTFDVDATTEEMTGLARKMLMVAHQDVSREAALAVIAMLDDVDYTPGRRRAIPDELTGGRLAYAFDLMMIGAYLPTDTLKVPLVPCVAEPGEAGVIQMIPWWIVARAMEFETGEDVGPTGRAPLVP